VPLKQAHSSLTALTFRIIVWAMQLALFDAPHTREDVARTLRTAPRKQSAPRDDHGEGQALALAELDERVHAYTEAAHAPNTKRAYRSDWAAFEAWCSERGECAMPASSSTLARFLAFLADSGKKASTIRRARVAVGLAHGWAGIERPDKDVTIRTVERGIARTGRERRGPTRCLRPTCASSCKRSAAGLTTTAIAPSSYLDSLAPSAPRSW